MKYKTSVILILGVTLFLFCCSSNNGEQKLSMNQSKFDKYKGSLVSIGGEDSEFWYWAKVVFKDGVSNENSIRVKYTSFVDSQSNYYLDYFCDKSIDDSFVISPYPGDRTIQLSNGNTKYILFNLITDTIFKSSYNDLTFFEIPLVAYNSDSEKVVKDDVRVAISSFGLDYIEFTIIKEDGAVKFKSNSITDLSRSKVFYSYFDITINRLYYYKDHKLMFFDLNL